MTGPVVLDIAGTALAPDERERLRHPNAGLVILFARNYEDPRQLAELTRAIHALRDPPLTIAVDHEGGRVQRFRDGFTTIAAMRELGVQWRHDVLGACARARSTGYVIGAELRACGVDLSFAPVLDLDWARSDVIGARAIDRDPRVVAMLAGHLMHGLALAGMANCGKHFPGHGWASADSHRELPVDERSLDDILANDAAPYGWLGIGLAAVMPAHVVYPQVDALPAGFSRRWIEEILRGRLGFSGAVFSDDLSMSGAHVAGDVVARAEAALAAGCDFALVCNDRGAADRVLEQLRWTPGAASGARRERILPRGEALSRDALPADPRYRQALADLGPVHAMDDRAPIA